MQQENGRSHGVTPYSYHTPKERQLPVVPELQTISLISHPSKVMLEIILNRLQPQAEEIVAEEQAGFRAGRSTTEQIFNLRILADDIVVNAEEEEEAGELVDRLDKTTTRYKMEIGPDKTKVMTKHPNGFQREIKIEGQRPEEVENFKYLGAIISNEGSKPEILSRIAQTTAALSRLKIIWRDKNISLASKVKLMRTLI